MANDGQLHHHRTRTGRQYASEGGSFPWSGAVDAEVVEDGGGGWLVAALGDEPDARRRADRECPRAAPMPVPPVDAPSGAVSVQAARGRVGQPEPRGGGRRSLDHAAVGQPPGVRQFPAELDLPGVPDGDVAEPGEVVVARVDDQAGLLVVADGVDAEV